jgi:hypothetical protein
VSRIVDRHGIGGELAKGDGWRDEEGRSGMSGSSKALDAMAVSQCDCKEGFTGRVRDPCRTPTVSVVAEQVGHGRLVDNGSRSEPEPLTSESERIQLLRSTLGATWQRAVRRAAWRRLLPRFPGGHPPRTPEG